MPLVLSAFGFQSQKQYHPWAVTQAAESHALRSCSRLERLGSRQPPAVTGWLRSYTMNRLDDDSDLLKILRCAFETYNTLKSGYLESVYEAALEYELLQAGFSVSRQVRIPVFYKGVELKKDFYADMVVNDRIILELKAVSTINPAHEKQLVSYMKSTGIKEGMLLNFGHVRRLEWRAFSP